MRRDRAVNIIAARNNRGAIIAVIYFFDFWKKRHKRQNRMRRQIRPVQANPVNKNRRCIAIFDADF